MLPVIEVQHLSKDYEVQVRREGLVGNLVDLISRQTKIVSAVKDISFQISPGEVIGYIGQNGAGKSTTIKMMSGILKPSSGKVSVFGFDPARDRKRYAQHIGVVFGQRSQLWWDIALIESFHLLRKIYRVPEVDYRGRLQHLTEILGLGDILHTPVRKLSLGQRMRGELAASLLHGPKILFLDEPTIGLDQIAKHSVRSFLKQINRDFQTTILLTTHDLTEIEELCERILIIDKGQLIFNGSLQELKALPGLGRRVIIDFGEEAPVSFLESHYREKELHVEKLGERRLVCGLDPKKLSPLEFIKRVSEQFSVIDVSITEPSIEEVVLKVYTVSESLRAPSV